MSHLTESERFPDTHHQELIFPCDCSDGDYLRITWDDDPEWRYLWIEHNQRVTGLNRVRFALRALMGRQNTHGEIILSSESVAGLREFLDGAAE